MAPMAPTVSVIIPTHNRYHFLKRAIQSVLLQTFQDFEIIVVDDGSSIGAKNEINNIQREDPRVQVLRHPSPRGVSVARNSGIAISRGKYLAFLDDDDSWLPAKLACQLSLFSHQHEIVACSSAYVAHYPLGIKRTICPPMAPTLQALIKANVLGGGSMLFCATEVIKRIGCFNPLLCGVEDWDMWVRLRKIGHVVTVQRPLVNYYVQFKNNMTTDYPLQYISKRKFYFIYRSLMDPETKQFHRRRLCFVQSKQASKTIFARIKALLLAIKGSPFRIKLIYFRSSVLKLLHDCFYTPSR